ncbi:MAG: DnaJ C-terminal domain-containing protein [Saprospiraceae bacterium]
MENGQTIKIAGHGGPGVNGGPNGDLYITFSIAQHPKIQRLGNDLYTSVDLDLYTAILGGEITIDTLDGQVKLKVKPETQDEQSEVERQRLPRLQKRGEIRRPVCNL